MPATAFSKHYGKELDVEQLLKLLHGAPDGPVDTTLSDLSPDLRNFIRTDIECPSCFKRGAELVAAGRSRTTGKLVRQACFRFKDGDGGEGHHPFCDFYQETAKECLPDNLLSFGSPRSEVTRAVGELVCHGVKLGVFDQRRMRDLRLWFFNAKLTSHFEVSIDSQVIEWVAVLGMRLPYERTVSFNPLYADIPGFDWAAIRDAMTVEASETVSIDTPPAGPPNTPRNTTDGFSRHGQTAHTTEILAERALIRAVSSSVDVR